MWWAGLAAVLTGLGAVAELLVSGGWVARVLVVAVLPVAAVVALTELAGVRARVLDLEVDLQIRLRQEDSDRVLGRLRAAAPHRPLRLHVDCAHPSRDGVDRHVALVKAYMSTRPYDLEAEVYEQLGGAAQHEALLSYRLRDAG